MLKDDGTTHLFCRCLLCCSGVASSLSISLPSRRGSVELVRATFESLRAVRLTDSLLT